MKVLLLVWMVSMAGSGCGKKDEAKPDPAPGSAAAAPARVAPANAAYIVLDRKGLVAIEDRAFRTVVKDEFVGRAVPRRDGGLWVYVGKQVARYDGELAPLAGAPSELGPVAVGRDGTLWVTSRGALSSYDGKEWKAHELSPAIGKRSPGPIVFGADATVYVAAGNSIVVRRGDTWSEVPSADVVSGLAIAGDGTVYVATDKQLSRLVDGTLTAIAKVVGEHPRLLSAPDGTVYMFGTKGTRRIAGDKLEPLTQLPFLVGEVIGPDGTIYGLPSGGMRILRRRTDGSVDKLPANADLPFAAKGISVDGRNRLWLRLEYGMAVIDGEKLTLITPGTVPEISRNVDNIVIAGDGPELPDVGAPKLINLAGSFVANGKPKAGVKLEICPGVGGVFSGSSPCDGKSFVRRATSDASGNFKVADLPIGGWHIVYKTSRDSWVFYFPPGCCDGLENGATFDMGQVEFGKSSK